MELINKVYTSDNLGLMHINTLNKKNIYLVYDWKLSTIRDILQTFRSNYNLENNQTELIHSKTHMLLDHLDPDKTMRDIGFEQIEYFLILNKYQEDPTCYVRTLFYPSYDNFFVSIQINNQLNKRILLKSNQFTTINDLKYQIQNIEQIHPSNQILSFNNLILNNEYTLADYDMIGPVTIQLKISNQIEHSEETYTETSGCNGNYERLKDTILFVDISPDQTIEFMNFYPSVELKI